jgi:hypothetical protein
VEELIEHEGPKYFKFLSCNTEITPVMIREILCPPNDCPMEVRALIEAAIVNISVNKKYKQAMDDFKVARE